MIQSIEMIEKLVRAKLADGYNIDEHEYRNLLISLWSQWRAAELELVKIDRRGYETGYWTGQAQAYQEAIQFILRYPSFAIQGEPVAPEQKPEVIIG